jgi:hypothetical protein
LIVVSTRSICFMYDKLLFRANWTSNGTAWRRKVWPYAWCSQLARGEQHTVAMWSTIPARPLFDCTTMSSRPRI